jgi:hypothetical protein
MFDAVQVRCAARAPVRYAIRNGATVAAACVSPLVAPRAYFIADAPALSIPD